MTLAELNTAAPDAAANELGRCCGSSSWIRQMVAARPFAHEAALYARASDIWRSLSREDWLEAFAHHPRIGERAAGWAGEEQAGVNAADRDTLRVFATRNADYERRFGHVFLICATGKSATEMLAQLELRMRHEPEQELLIAAEEQRQITRLRMHKLLHSHHASAP